ncbi:SDR family NAD(P)-dependent oxidoreductase [Pedobacter sp. ISL-68]|uniref:SDR family oxidoreductase n=1 Tax=unclassified Pedobacter TaxID=2628915 RepID=UPI001BE8780B|nr:MULTISPECIES: SDR family NAD(P)-dependent oxidoreductase [unclassified Pedobacter]MBT2560193.1 SDR family NAD(P)-dependent oxidoreductase [Pedobacter sp. ISL-64]MBT2589172.1 SDR family NAD(P)-dependent oxidoreductase [Pedobacter sp. ISL-68]
MEIKGKTILITGGAAGIGLEATKQFLAGGAKVIITGRDQAKLDAAKKTYPSITTIKSDVADANDAQSLFDQVKTLGGIDILYNNAGIMSGPANLGKADDKHFKSAEAEININYLGVIRLNNLFMDMLQSKKESAIINTSSVLSYVPFNLAPTYSASKAAVRFYTVALRDHLNIIGSKVKVFELLPPVVATSMTENLDTKTITPQKLIFELISAIKKNTYTIRVGDTKLVYLMHRIAPNVAYGLVNTAKNAKLLK